MPYHGVPYDFFRYTEQGLAMVIQEAGLLTVASFPGGTRRSVLAHLSGAQSKEVPESMLSRQGAHDRTQIAQEERARFCGPWRGGAMVQRCWRRRFPFSQLHHRTDGRHQVPATRRRGTALALVLSARLFCGTTEYRVNRRCGQQSGAWPLNANETTDWLVAMEACATGCQQRCGRRCAYISVSLTQADCSWFQVSTVSCIRSIVLSN